MERDGGRGEGGGRGEDLEGGGLTRAFLAGGGVVSFVPQDGCLAAIFLLLALIHCACLRNARRIS